MKALSMLLFIAYLQLATTVVFAVEPANQNEILAQRGEGVVTQKMFAARVDKIPADLRLTALRDGNRFRDILNDILLRAQLAEEAREAGFDQEPIIVDRMKLAAEAELADAWLKHYLDMQPSANYDQLAREYYQLHKATILSSPKIDVSHILISNAERSDEEARALADSVYQQIMDSPDSFDDLVKKYSDDPSASANQGRFFQVKRGDMVGSFEKVAFDLETGEISEPVQTGYGYHIIRLDAHIAPQMLAYEDVRSRLTERQRKKHKGRIEQDYLGTLTSLDVKMRQEALDEMARRQFGDDIIDPEAIEGDSE